MKIKLFLLRATYPDAEIWDDDAVHRAYITRAPDETIAREQPKRDESWFPIGNKSPWKDATMTSCTELGEIDVQADSPEAATQLVLSFR